MREGSRKHTGAVRKISVLIAEDASLIRRPLRKLLEGLSELSVVADCPIRELIDQARKSLPEVALINVVDPTVRHVELTRSLRQLSKSVEVILMSQFKHPEIIRNFFGAGGGACLETEVANTTLLAAIRRVAAGRKYIDPDVSDEAVVAMVGDKGRPHAILSRREREVLRLLASGYTYKEAAQTLRISPATVETYRERINEKADIRSRAELVRYALLHRILPAGGEASVA